MLQRSNGYCRGDKTLGWGRGATETERDGGWGEARDGVAAREGARCGGAQECPMRRGCRRRSFVRTRLASSPMLATPYRKRI
jgi:hypothetical protein